MKFNLVLLITILLSSCMSTHSSKILKESYSSKGFSIIYNEKDYIEKNITKKFDNSKEMIGHNFLRPGTILKITNPETNISLTSKIQKKVQYPDFYKLLITEKMAAKLNLDYDYPYLEFEVLKKNKSFIAKKAVTYSEEKQIHNNAPVEKVVISNISKSKISNKKKIKKFSIIIASFYSKESANLLKDRLNNELSRSYAKKMKIFYNKKNNYDLLLGPFNSVNSLKNGYIEVKKLGFEEIDIKINE